MCFAAAASSSSMNVPGPLCIGPDSGAGAGKDAAYPLCPQWAAGLARRKQSRMPLATVPWLPDEKGPPQAFLLLAILSCLLEEVEAQKRQGCSLLHPLQVRQDPTFSLQPSSKIERQRAEGLVFRLR